MDTAELKTKIKKLEATIERLETKLGVVDDTVQIEKLQRIYGYYLDSGRHQEIVDLFSDDTESVEVANRGVYLGKEGARRFFMESQGRPRPSWAMARHLQLQGVVNVDPGGKTAKGRWQCLFMSVGSFGTPAVPTALWGYGVYENEYIKENGKWMFQKLYFNRLFFTPFEEGWAKVPDITEIMPKDIEKADRPTTTHHPYPTNYVVPLHYKHPITDK